MLPHTSSADCSEDKPPRRHLQNPQPRRRRPHLSRICFSICMRAGRAVPYTLRSISSRDCSPAGPASRCICSTGWLADAPSLSVTSPWRSASCGSARKGRLSCCRRDGDGGRSVTDGSARQEKLAGAGERRHEALAHGGAQPQTGWRPADQSRARSPWLDRPLARPAAALTAGNARNGLRTAITVALESTKCVASAIGPLGSTRDEGRAALAPACRMVLRRACRAAECSIAAIELIRSVP